ncbi:MAG: GPW/gp25 family protein [Candidatus Kariarchaeaceae archaeon]|jgi:phage baseplate assembly protein W
MAVQRISRAFKDISLSFDMHPVTKDILVLKNEDAIKRSIRNLVQTVPTERFFNPTIGADVKTSLFEFVDFGTASVLQKQIEIAIQNYEPRVESPRVVVDPRPDLNAFEINITFTIVGLEVPRQQFSYILEATR